MSRWKSVTPRLLASNRSERMATFATRLRRVIDKDGSNSLVYHTTSRTP